MPMLKAKVGNSWENVIGQVALGPGLAYNKAGVLDSAANARIVGDGNLALSQSAVSTPSASTRAKIASLQIGNTTLPCIVPPKGRRALIAPFGWQHFGWGTQWNNSIITNYGIYYNISKTNGTENPTPPTDTNAWSRARRIELLTTSTAYVRYSATPTFQWIKSLTDMGFLMVLRAGPATGLSNPSHRFMMGMFNNGSTQNDSEASVQVNGYWLGYDSTDTRVQMMYNDATGVATKIDLGAAFPKPSVDKTDFYELILFQDWDVRDDYGYATVNWMVTNMATGAMVTGAITGKDNVPDNIGLSLGIKAGTGTASTTIGIAFFDCQMWTQH